MDWNTRVADWEDVAASPAFQRLADHVISAAEPTPEDAAIDLGAGTGLLTLRLAPVVGDVIAIDNAPAMVEYLDRVCANDALANVSCRIADLRELGLPDGSRTLAVSNYAYHHMDHAGKRAGLHELHRVLAPGGRLVICDMMFALSLRPRDRQIILEKVRLMARRGPAGVVRILRNAGRVATGTWEHPERPEAWIELLSDAGFVDIRTRELGNEAGMAVARRPA